MELDQTALAKAAQALLSTKPYELRDSPHTMRRARIDAETAVRAYLANQPEAQEAA